jgi:hypothetical protein
MEKTNKTTWKPPVDRGIEDVGELTIKISSSTSSPQMILYILQEEDLVLDVWIIALSIDGVMMRIIFSDSFWS